MKTEMIDNKCFFCDEEANAKVIGNGRELPLCKKHAKDLLFEIASEGFQFQDD